MVCQVDTLNQSPQHTSIDSQPVIALQGKQTIGEIAMTSMAVASRARQGALCFELGLLFHMAGGKKSPLHLGPQPNSTKLPTMKRGEIQLNDN